MSIDGDFAVFTGKPAFIDPLHVGRPNMGEMNDMLTRLKDIWDIRWLTNNGPYVRKFESMIAEMVGVRHCIAVCNATTGLAILARVLGLSGEVIIPLFTFVATAHALQWQGITPVFADIDLYTHTLDPMSVQNAITPRTRAIMGVHLWGHSCNIEELQRIARRHRLHLVFDAAHAFGCQHQGKMMGSFGDAEVFSFHGTKIVNTGEGGAIVTNNDDIAARIRLARNFGFEGEDNVVRLGMNGKMNELSAALGITNLESMEQFVETNHRHYRHYCSDLDGLPGITMMSQDEKMSNCQYIVLEIENAGLSRDSLLKVLRGENVFARRYFYPGCHRMEPYRSLRSDIETSLKNTEAVCERVVCLPTGTALTDDDVSVVCRLIRKALGEGPSLERRLTERQEGCQ